MVSIRAVRIGRRLLELTSPDLISLDGLFDIDTVNLLLGKNGAGKTRFLLETAKGLIQESEIARFYFAPKITAHDICCIYYSALPYRRKMPQRVGFIDASPSSRVQNQDDEAKLHQLRDVAEALGVDTTLTGVFGYTNNVYRVALIPALEKYASAITDSKLKNLIYKYTESISQNASENENIKLLDDKNELYLKEIDSRLSNIISKYLENTEKCLWLGTIEHLYGTSKESGQSASIAFLTHFNIFSRKLISKDFEILESISEGFEILERVVERTREILKRNRFFKNLRDSDKMYRFTIKGLDHFSEIRLLKTAVKIEWSDLSSGLHALVDQFSLIRRAIATAVSKNRLSILLLIDEGDAFLHLEWQRKYFSLLNRYLGEIKKTYNLRSLQLVLATHSPIIAADLPGLVVTNLDVEKENEIRMETFAAPIEKVISQSFESSSLGEFATLKINEAYRRAKQSKLRDVDRIVIESIGDSAILATFKKEMKNDN